MPSPCVTLFWVPSGDVRQSDRGAPPGKAGAESRHEYRRHCRGIGDEPGRNRRDDHHTEKKPSSAVPVRPHAKHDAHQGARQEWDAEEQPELRVRKAVLSLDFDPDDCEDRPYCKAADITYRRDHQDPPAEALEPGNGVFGVLTRHDLGGLVHGHAKLNPQCRPLGLHQLRELFLVDHVGPRRQFFDPARRTT